MRNEREHVVLQEYTIFTLRMRRWKSWINQWKRHIFLRRCITKWKSKSFSTRIALSELVPYYRHFAPLYTAHAQLKSWITPLKTPFLLEKIYCKMKENIFVYRNTLTGTCTLLPELYPALHCACAVKVKNYSLKTPFLLEKIYCKMKANMLFYRNTQSSHCACADKIMNYPMKTPYFLEKMYNKMKEQIVFYKNSLIGTCTLLPALCPALHCACVVKITNYSLKKLFLLERIYYQMKENILVYRNTLTGTCTLLPELYPALHCACAVKVKNYSLKTPFLLEKIYCKMKENMLFYKNTQSSHCACADKIMN